MINLKRAEYFYRAWYYIIFIFAFTSCSNQTENNHQEYLRHIGDTEFDPDTDNPDFKLCDNSNAGQYYYFNKSLDFDDEKKNTISYFTKGFQSENVKKESGYITIRFVVNCKGETGWFRIQQMDNSFQAKSFDSSIVDQLLMLTKKITTEELHIPVHEQYDYYKYYTFKIEAGEIKEILP